MGANVCPDRERLPNDLATLEAPLRGEARRHSDDSATSFFRFEAENVLESRPTRVGDGFGEMAVLEHIRYSQVLDGDEGISVNVRPSRLVGVVFALAGDLEVLTGRLLRRFATTARTLLSAGRLALRSPELLLGPPEAARVLDCVPIGVGDEVPQSNVEADRIAVPLLGRISHMADNKDVPMTVGTQEKVRGLGSSFEGAVLLELDAAPELLRDSKPLGFGVEEHVPATSVLAKLYRVPAVRSLEAREADFLSKLLAMENPLEGFVKTVGKRLHSRLRDVLAASPLEAVREVATAEELAGLIVMRLDHLKHLVVKTAALRQTGKEHRVLGAVDEKPVLESLMHVPTVLEYRGSVNGVSPGRWQAQRRLSTRGSW